MTTYDASQAECLVFTFKEGLLSRAAHDLKLVVRSFQVDTEGGQVRATFDPRSLEVICAMKKGRENPGALSASDKRQVVENTLRDVLHTARFPSITFTSTEVTPVGSRLKVKGDLDLHGVSRPITATVEKVGERWQTRVTLHQPDWRIKPFTALLGTLKIKPDVEVQLSIPADAPLGAPA